MQWSRAFNLVCEVAFGQQLTLVVMKNNNYICDVAHLECYFSIYFSFQRRNMKLSYITINDCHIMSLMMQHVKPCTKP
jgi:hypothetical protein